jgi:hypothetical protein
MNSNLANFLIFFSPYPLLLARPLLSVAYLITAFHFASIHYCTTASRSEFHLSTKFRPDHAHEVSVATLFERSISFQISIIASVPSCPGSQQTEFISIPIVTLNHQIVFTTTSDQLPTPPQARSTKTHITTTQQTTASISHLLFPPLHPSLSIVIAAPDNRHCRR